MCCRCVGVCMDVVRLIRGFILMCVVLCCMWVLGIVYGTPDVSRRRYCFHFHILSTWLSSLQISIVSAYPSPILTRPNSYGFS